MSILIEQIDDRKAKNQKRESDARDADRTWITEEKRINVIAGLIKFFEHRVGLKPDI
jgi:hypothetical protein